MAGITNTIGISADLVVASATLVTTGLSFSIAASQRASGYIFLPFTVGATGGVRTQLIVPAAGTAFNLALDQPAVTTGALIRTSTIASAVYTNALAVAGDYVQILHFSLINGATAGTVDMQIGQNTTDALTLTLQSGAFMQYTIW